MLGIVDFIVKFIASAVIIYYVILVTLRVIDIVTDYSIVWLDKLVENLMSIALPCLVLPLGFLVLLLTGMLVYSIWT